MRRRRIAIAVVLSTAVGAGTLLFAQEADLQRDIAALKQFHAPAKKAAARLVERGDDILAQLHAAMNAPDADIVQKSQLATVVGQIGDESSVRPLVAMATAAPQEGGVRQAVLDSLAALPVSSISNRFADAVLADKSESWRVRRKALVYFGQHRVESARRWIDVYREDEQIEMRAGALYLSARLGDASALDPMTEMLALPAPRSLRYALMLGIAELAGPDEFTSRTPDWIHAGWEYESARRYCEFRVADEDRRSEMTTEMLDSQSLFERQEAARHILESRGEDGLKELIRPTIPPHVKEAARHQLRRGGFRVRVQADGRVSLQRKEQP